MAIRKAAPLHFLLDALSVTSCLLFVYVFAFVFVFVFVIVFVYVFAFVFVYVFGEEFHRRGVACSVAEDGMECTQ